MSTCIAIMYGHSCAAEDGHGRDHVAANGYAWTQPERDGGRFIFHNGSGTSADYGWASPKVTLTTHIGHYGKQVDPFDSVESARDAVRLMAVGFGYDMPFGSAAGRFERRGGFVGSWTIEEK